MTIYDFMILSSEEQLAHVMFFGNLVTKLRTKAKHYHLYSVNNFFFEMEYDANLSTNRGEAFLLRRHIFSTGVRMEKYLNFDLVI